jgi:hypothetical protein
VKIKQLAELKAVIIVLSNNPARETGSGTGSMETLLGYLKFKQ